MGLSVLFVKLKSVLDVLPNIPCAVVSSSGTFFGQFLVGYLRVLENRRGFGITHWPCVCDSMINAYTNYTGFIPWAGHDAEQIQRQVCNQKMLKVNDSRVPQRFVEVLTYGLQPNPHNRKMNMEQIRDVLSLMPRVGHSCYHIGDCACMFSTWVSVVHYPSLGHVS